MELSCSNIKEFLIFSYTPGNGNFEKYSLYLRKRKPKLKRNYYTSRNKDREKISNIFSKESCSYISGNGKSEKISYIFSKKSLYSGKRKPRKNSLYLSRNFENPKNRNFLYFSKKIFSENTLG